jgi:hypothetical protein
MPFATDALIAMPMPEPSDAPEVPPPIDGRVHALLLEIATLETANARSGHKSPHWSRVPTEPNGPRAPPGRAGQAALASRTAGAATPSQPGGHL